MFSKETKSFFIAVSVLIGTCIGAGVLGIPYVAAKAGFIPTLVYIVLIGLIILLVNLYLGEISLRTMGDHQLVGYAKKYFGKKGKYLMEFAAVFGIYAALIAYMLGVGESISFLIFGNINYSLFFGIIFGGLMSFLIKGGVGYLKRFEKVGVIIILVLLSVIFILFVDKVNVQNLLTSNIYYLFLPFGVVLFALMAFHSVPEVRLVLKGNEKLFKKTILTGTLISVIFYILFALVVVGFKGNETPEVATLALGNLFVFLGIFTMFTSYLAQGNALFENFIFDDRWSKKISWFFSSIVPIVLFALVYLFPIFSFTNILSIGGVFSGGILAIMVLLMVKKAKQKGERTPEYSISGKWWVIGVVSLIFIFGVIREIFLAIR